MNRHAFSDHTLCCPHCGMVTQALTEVTGDLSAEPPIGRPIFCRQCGEWTVMGDDLQLHIPTDKALEEIAKDRFCQKYKQDWQNEHQRGIWQ